MQIIVRLALISLKYTQQSNSLANSIKKYFPQASLKCYHMMTQCKLFYWIYVNPSFTEHFLKGFAVAYGIPALNSITNIFDRLVFLQNKQLLRAHCKLATQSLAPAT